MPPRVTSVSAGVHNSLLALLSHCCRRMALSTEETGGFRTASTSLGIPNSTCGRRFVCFIKPLSNLRSTGMCSSGLLKSCLFASDSIIVEGNFVRNLLLLGSL
ncbi:hypothetical protein GALMADRAFT_918984 [Galerina marginata CBS 339.88]|uniref:Uncharacterized protein n=1 Tax=Galerina marginata (strain CBS 339.88) TaxID=685588 RepID=A0A067SRE2_GALM3|nr:hypothetical protein GALMADRAFT_918984 [Galerina marginata CBS 339.88]